MCVLRVCVGVDRWGAKGVSGEQLWRHSQMKSNLIVITVAAALITTTVRIIQPPYSSVSPSHRPPLRAV